jgi:hypothetical protein
MAVDAGIALGVKPIQLESPVNQLANVLQIQNAQQANKLNDQKLQQSQFESDRNNKIYSAIQGLGPNATVDQHVQTLRGLGAYKMADEALAGVKTAADVGKTTADTKYKELETANKQIELAGSTLGFVMKNPTLENANAALDFLAQNKVYSPEQIAQYKAQVAADPQSIYKLAEMGYRAALSAKDQLLTISTRNNGGSTDTLANDLVTGQARVTNSVRNTASPDALLSAETQRRGQNMTDARAREVNSIAQDNKPLTEGQSKSALFGSRMQDANDILEKLAASGTNVSTPGMNSGYGIGTLVNTLSSNNQQQLAQAKRNFINAALRRESGAVIADSEFQNAEKQYFPQIGDGPEVIAQKKANREAATRGVLVDVPESRRERIVRDIRGANAQATTSPQDAQALEWANANPNDPRAAQIKKRLGQ